MSSPAPEEPRSLLSQDTRAGKAAREAAAARSRRVRRLGAGAAVGAVVAGLAFGGYALANRDSTLPPPVDGKPVPEAPVITPDAQGRAPEQAELTVLMDGWSLRTLQGRNLGYRTPDGRTGRLSFAPVSTEGVKTLAKSTPEVVTTAMARVVTDDPTLTCDEDGCSGDKVGPVAFSTLTQPSAVPHLGPSYQGWQVQAGLYAATVKATAGEIILTADGYDELSLQAIPAGKNEVTGEDLAPSVDNGYLRGRYLVAAGLGRFFLPQPAWLGTAEDPVRFHVSDALDAADGAVDTVAEAGLVLAGARGLGAPLEVAAQWSPSLLTYATSPTTGCGPLALCAPDELNVKVSPALVKVANACPVEGEGKAVAALQQVHLKVDLPAPVNQFGLNGDGRWGEPVNLVEGEQELTFTVAALFDGPQAQLRSAGGRIDPGKAGEVSLQDALAALRFGGEYWKTC